MSKWILAASLAAASSFAFAGTWNGGTTVIDPSVFNDGNPANDPGELGASGSITNVLNWDNGGDLNGLYGNPRFIQAGNNLAVSFFDPNGFIAASSDTGSKSDTVSVDIELLNGLQLAGASFMEDGDFSLGFEGFEGTVDVFAELTLQRLDSNGQPVGAPISRESIENYNFQTAVSGTWDGSASINLVAEDPFNQWTRFRLSWENSLSATDAFGVAEIEKLGSLSRIEFEVIPEPTSVMLLALLGLIRRR